MEKQKVTGIGGVFLVSDDPAALSQWYRDMLGIEIEWDHGHSFQWKEDEAPGPTGMTVWSIFPSSTLYLEPSTSRFMINYRVQDLHAMLAQLRDAGATVMDKVEESDYGKFGWAVDPDGNKIELWEPPAE